MKYALITGANSGLAHPVIASIKDDYFLILTDVSEALSEAYTDIPHKLIIIGDLTKKETISSLTVNKIYKTWFNYSLRGFGGGH